MRLPMLATALTCFALPALAQPVGCNRFEGVGMAGTLEIAEDGESAILETADTTTRYDLASCGMESLSYCGTNAKDEEDTTTLAFVTGRMSATDDEPDDFVLVDGLYQYEAVCRR